MNSTKTGIISSFHKLFILFIALTFTSLALPATSQATPANYDKTLTWSIPDLSQINDPSWPPTYCAPTAATNTLWAYYAAGDTTLIQAGTTDNDKADNTITTLASPTYMNTDPNSGTSTIDMVNGLQAYSNDFGSSPYTVTLLTAFNTGTGGGVGDGSTLLDAMMNDLYSSAHIIPIIKFGGAGTGSQGEVEELKLDYSGENTSPIGHTVTMTGFDYLNSTITVNDPANNSTHNWSPEYSTWGVTFPLSYTSDYIYLSSGPYSGNWIVGAVAITAVPEPSSLLLIGSGLIGIVCLGRRRMR